jgi:hypothetical protein
VAIITRGFSGAHHVQGSFPGTTYPHFVLLVNKPSTNSINYSAGKRYPLFLNADHKGLQVKK